MSGQAVISVENLGKVYRLNHQAARQRYVALRDVLTNKVKRVFRPQRWPNGPRSQEDFWALKNVSFEVKQGEVIGIIGRNGAGKSTLLKVLSRITEPSKGRVRVKGRVASLLEVGTGFHPELTGRENIFLNGAILGMSRAEIRRKFDEIVAFAEVEQFLDTAVKHYSSGMYVRLAFAVAAHLEPEILVVDEVLAVGDAEFQKKSLGKMNEVSRGGRTIFFVSHNIAAIKTLTTRSVVLQSGRVLYDGATDQAIQRYAAAGAKARNGAGLRNWGRGHHTAIRDVRLLDSDGRANHQYVPGAPLWLQVEFDTDGAQGMSLELFLMDATRARVGMSSTYQLEGRELPTTKGTYLYDLRIDQLWLAAGEYSVEAATSMVNVRWDHRVDPALDFEVVYSSPCHHGFNFKQTDGYGVLALLSSSSPAFRPLHAISPMNDLSEGLSATGSANR